MWVSLASREECPWALCSVAPLLFPTTCLLVGSRACLHAAASGSSQGLLWGVEAFEGEGVRTGGRLHPGQAGKRLLKQRLKLAHDVGTSELVSELDVSPSPPEKTFIDSGPYGGESPFVCLPSLALLTYERQLHARPLHVVLVHYDAPLPVGGPIGAPIVRSRCET